MNLKKILATVFFAATISISAQADTLKMKSVGTQPPNSPQGVLRPVNGMSMDTVLQKFGEPAKKIPAVGEPPITRWVYEKFTVYFEYKTVIHAVVNR
jgi:hypothetical protein